MGNYTIDDLNKEVKEVLEIQPKYLESYNNVPKGLENNSEFKALLYLKEEIKDWNDYHKNARTEDAYSDHEIGKYEILNEYDIGIIDNDDKLSDELIHNDECYNKELEEIKKTDSLYKAKEPVINKAIDDFLADKEKCNETSKGNYTMDDFKKELITIKSLSKDRQDILFKQSVNIDEAVKKVGNNIKNPSVRAILTIQSNSKNLSTTYCDIIKCNFKDKLKTVDAAVKLIDKAIDKVLEKTSEKVPKINNKKKELER